MSRKAQKIKGRGKRNHSPWRADPHFQALDDLPLWLRNKLAAQLQTWQDGDFDTCTHQPTYASGKPVYMVAWLAHMVVCPGCAHLTNMPASHSLAHICDKCAHICAETPDDHLVCARLQFGRVTYVFGVCSDCRKTM